jgi:hypothetical protein
MIMPYQRTISQDVLVDLGKAKEKGSYVGLFGLSPLRLE